MTLRKVVLLLPLLLSAFFTSAETYVLGYEQLKAKLETFQPSATWNSYSGTFTDNSIEWSIEVKTLSDVSSKFNNVIRNDYLWIKPVSTHKINHVTFSTSGFIGSRISKITIDATMRNGLDQETEQTLVVAQPDTIFNETFSIYSGSIVGDIVPVEVSFDNDMIQDRLAISFEAPSGGDLVFKNITIEYESTPVPVVSMSETIPVGHAIELTADLPDAVIYYSIDNSENWLEYEASTGVVFSEPGTYTLKYYGESANGEGISEILAERIEVVQPKGIAALRAACEEIEIAGVVCGHADGYVLVGDESGSRAAGESIAVDATNFPELLSATVGSSIVASGRATDRFGSMPAIGSLSALTINNVPSTPTAIFATPASEDCGAAPTYNLKGQRVTSTASRRQIVIANGRLTLPN